MSRGVHQRCVAALSIIGATLLISQARAETDADKADALYQKGKAAFLERRWLDAERAYLAAWQIKSTFDVAANLAQAEMRLHKHRQAAYFAARSLRDAPPSSKQEQREATRELLNEAKTKVGVLRIKVDVSNASVLIDGTSIPPEDLPFDIFVEPGLHTIVARRDGYIEARATSNVSAGAEQDVSLKLAKIIVEKRPLWPAIVIGGVGASTLALGAAFIGVAESKRGEAKALAAQTACPVGDPSPVGKCAELTSLASSIDKFGNAGIGLFIATGVAAAGVATYMLLPKQFKTSSTALSPMMGPQAGGLIISGSF